jgi:acyl-coenzyme A synthetase/AMP-(fatty) acid ligase
VIPDAARSRDPEYLVDEIARHRVTIWNSAPTLLTLLVEHVSDPADERLRSIRLVLLGGDWIPVRLPDRLRLHAPAAQVVALGGATEVSIHSTIFLVGAVDPAWASIPYGRPMANQRVYVLDAQMQPVPIGVPGELYIGGVGVADGYLNRAALSRERFLDNPFVPGDRLFRTGDLVRWRSDGNLVLLGRLDFQVKLHGLRVDLGEIEAVLLQSGHVNAAAAVVQRAAMTGNPRVVAYVVPNAAPVDVAMLRTDLEKKLPAYMVPSAIVPLPALPLSPNGKIDRKALAARHEPTRHRPAESVLYESAADDMQRILLACWQDVLQIERIGIHDNFFSLGGDSVSCIRVAIRARQAGVPCAPNDIFACPTVETLSARLQLRKSH